MQQRLANRTPFYYGWVVLVAAGSAMFVRNAAASLTIAVFVYPLSEELGWSRTLISGAAAAGGLAATFMSPLVGRLIDRYGARTVLTVSILLLCASTMLLRWSDIALVTPSVAISWWVIDLKVPSLIIPLVFYIGYATGRVIFSSPVQIGAAVVVSRWFIRLRGRTNGILNMSHSVGMVLFPLIASIIIVQSGWRDAWFVLSVLVFVAALLPVAILISERPEDLGLRPDGDLEDDSAGDEDSVAQSDVAEEPEWTAEEAKRTATLWLIALATGLLFLMQAGTNTHSAAFFQDQGLGAVIAGFGIS
ncbi:MAG: MFS transporter, partial [Chloroflexi bacterium]|nr:MFS transporter [Chloroflexota bacterium]